jgi:hypothetical protein
MAAIFQGYGVSHLCVLVRRMCVLSSVCVCWVHLQLCVGDGSHEASALSLVACVGRGGNAALCPMPAVLCVPASFCRQSAAKQLERVPSTCSPLQVTATSLTSQLLLQCMTGLVPKTEPVMAVEVAPCRTFALTIPSGAHAMIVAVCAHAQPVSV